MKNRGDEFDRHDRVLMIVGFVVTGAAVAISIAIVWGIVKLVNHFVS